MNKIRIYNEVEMVILLSNPNVERIINHSQIVYKNEFKLWAVKEKLFNDKKTSRQIFEEGNFDMNILDERTPQKRISSWVKKYQKFGENYFSDKNKYTYKSITKRNDRLKKIDSIFNNPELILFVVEGENSGKENYVTVRKLNDEKNNSTIRRLHL